MLRDQLLTYKMFALLKRTIMLKAQPSPSNIFKKIHMLMARLYFHILTFKCFDTKGVIASLAINITVLYFQVQTFHMLTAEPST